MIAEHKESHRGTSGVPRSIHSEPVHDLLPETQVQRQMKCAAEDRSLNREWTRMDANTREYTRIAAVIKCGFISNDSLNSAGYEVMAREQRILAFFDLIRVHSRPFAVQN